MERRSHAAQFAMIRKTEVIFEAIIKVQNKLETRYLVSCDR